MSIRHALVCPGHETAVQADILRGLRLLRAEPVGDGDTPDPAYIVLAASRLLPLDRIHRPAVQRELAAVGHVAHIIRAVMDESHGSLEPVGVNLRAALSTQLASHHRQGSGDLHRPIAAQRLARGVGGVTITAVVKLLGGVDLGEGLLVPLRRPMHHRHGVHAALEQGDDVLDHRQDRCIPGLEVVLAQRYRLVGKVPRPGLIGGFLFAPFQRHCLADGLVAGFVAG